MPKKLDSAFVTVRCEDARTAELEKLKIFVTGDHCTDIEFAGGVEAAIVFSERLA